MNSLKELSKEEVRNMQSRLEYLQMQNMNLETQIRALRDELRRKVG